MEATLSQTAPLSVPVGMLMRATAQIAPEDTLERAASEMRRNGVGILPVVENDILRGVVTETSLAIALAEGVSHLEPTLSATVVGQTIAPYATGAEALRRLADGDGLPLVVVDDLGRVVGLLSASDLYPRRRSLPRPSMVGGMATPFGVYLTNGAVQAGAKGFALMATGSVLFTLLFVSQLITAQIFPWLTRSGLPDSWVTGIDAAATSGLFLLGMRLIPLSGTHGAEHQVVHAIERGEELRPEVVRRMPRVHPRCGTNLAAAATLFLGVFSAEWIADLHLRFLVAAMVTVWLWRPIGSLLQQYVTTRRPTDAQLAGSIRSANELLERYAQSKISVPTFPVRLWNSGLFHVMAGSTLTYLLIYAIDQIFHLHLDL